MTHNAAHAIVYSMIVLFRLQNSDRGGGGLISLLNPFSVFTLARWCIARDWFGDDVKVLVIISTDERRKRSVQRKISLHDPVQIIRVGKKQSLTHSQTVLSRAVLSRACNLKIS